MILTKLTAVISLVNMIRLASPAAGEGLVFYPAPNLPKSMSGPQEGSRQRIPVLFKASSHTKRKKRRRLIFS